MADKKLFTDLADQYILNQQVLKKEQQVIIDWQEFINHNLLLYKMLSQLSSFPKGLLNEFHFIIEQQEIEAILILRKRIIYLSRRLLKKG